MDELGRTLRRREDEHKRASAGGGEGPMRGALASSVVEAGAARSATTSGDRGGSPSSQSSAMADSAPRRGRGRADRDEWQRKRTSAGRRARHRCWTRETGEPRRASALEAGYAGCATRRSRWASGPARRVAARAPRRRGPPGRPAAGTSVWVRRSGGGGRRFRRGDRAAALDRSSPRPAADRGAGPQDK